MDDLLKGMPLFENDANLNKRIGFLRASWTFSYPDVDLRKEIGWAHAWLIANQKRMKKDFPRFLNNWLRSAQDRAGSPIKPPHSLPAVKRYEVPEEDICTPDMFAELKNSLKGPREAH